MKFYCDIDNTTYDALSRIMQFYPEYNPITQVTYAFEKLVYLESFQDPTFYDNLENINVDLFDKLLEYRPETPEVQFYSKCVSLSEYEAKEKMLMELSKTLTNKGISVSKDPLLLRVDDLEQFQDIVDCAIHDFGADNVVFVDDNPERLGILIENGVSYGLPMYPYNRNFNEGAVLKFHPECMKKIIGG